MSYLLSSYHKLDFLTLIAFLVATLQTFFVASCVNVIKIGTSIFCDQSFLALLTQLCCLLILLQSDEQQGIIVCALC